MLRNGDNKAESSENSDSLLYSYDMLIDSHAHLDSPRYAEDREALLDRAWAAGVRTILSIGIGEGPDTMHQALDLSRQYKDRPETPKIFASAGIHPHEAQFADQSAYEKLDHLLRQPEVIACGEIGLDYFYDHSPRETQKQVFRRQMEIAAAHKQPIIIHCRPSENSTDAWDDTLESIRRAVEAYRPRRCPSLLYRRMGPRPPRP